MKKIIIALSILSILLIGGIKLGLSYFSQQFVDNQIRQMSSFVQFSYKSIETSIIEGNIIIKNIKAFIPAIKESVHINAITLTAPDAKSLFTINKQLQKNELPRSLNVLFSGISLDLDSSFMKSLDDPKANISPIEVISSLACGDIHRIGGSVLSQMGYDSLKSDISLNYTFDPHNKTLNYTIKNKFYEVAQINFSGVLHEVSNLESFSKRSIRLGTTELEILDNEYMLHKNRFCAKQEKGSLDDYYIEHTRQFNNYLSAYGIKVGIGLLDAYQDMLKQSAALTLTANLINLSGTEEIIFFAPNDLIQFIQLKLFVNDEQVNKISLDIDKNKLVNTLEQKTIVLKTKAEKKKQVALASKKYRVVAVSNLRKYNGFRVKLKTKSGKRYKGKIITKNPNRYEIVTRYRSGNISYFVAPKSIKKVEVFNWK